MRLLMTLLAISAIITLWATDPTIRQNRTEHDPDLRDACLHQLLTIDQEPLTAGTIVGTLNYVDRQYGGPCAALDHRLENGWY